MKPFRPLAELPDLPSCDPSKNLLELMPVPGAQAWLLDALRVIEAISPSIPLWVDRQGIKCRLSDGSRRQLFLDVEFNRFLFYIYHQQSPLEMEIANSRMFVSALARRHNSKKYIHLKIPKSNSSQLHVGRDLSLNLKSCKPITHAENRIEPLNVPADLPAASFQINRQELVDAIQDIRSISDNKNECLYVVKDGRITLSASGPSGHYEHPISSCWNRCNDRAYRLLNLSIILRCLKASRCETVWITEHSDGFLRIEFSLGLAIEVNLYAAMQRVEHVILR